MTLPSAGSCGPERLGSGGAAWAVTRREHRFKGKEPEGASGRERPRVPGSKARPGKRTVSHRWVMLPGDQVPPPFSPPLPETGPQPLDRGASEEEAGSSRASRGNSDVGDPQRLRTRQESGGRRC